MKLLIIRHGDPDYEHDSLTERGWTEARLLADRLEKENITKVYCSPLGRAKATAEPFLERTHLPVEICDWLREFPRPIVQPLKELGLASEDWRSCPWDMKPGVFNAYADILTDTKKWMTHPMYQDNGAAEQAEVVRKGLCELLLGEGLVADDYFYHLKDGVTWDSIKDQNIAVFCHMGLGSLLMAYLAHVAPPVYWQMFRVMPTSVSTIVFQKDAGNLVQSKIFMVGDTTHLSSIGLTYRG